MVESQHRKWLALALLSVVQFMVVLDLAIENVALPSIQLDLGFSQEDLQWVISAYALVFGGFLLLGGRAADMLGRRRLFLIGILVFTLASLFAGFAWSDASLIAARSLQGLGAAIITPAALSILSTTFSEGRDRNVALGVWGAVGGFGAAAGLLLGGVLTDTAGLSALVYAITQAGQEGWLAGRTAGFFAAALSLLAGFVVWERRHPEPLMRLAILRTRTLAGANVASLILNVTTLSTFLMLTLYMQQVLEFSPMQTGFAFLAIAGTAIVWSTVAAQLVTRVGFKPVLLVGLAALSGALVYLTEISADGTYVTDLLPGFLLMALGIGFSFVPTSIAALAGVDPHEAGLASGLINTSQQIGGAPGLAVVSTLATARTDDALARGASRGDALVTGFRGALFLSVAVALLGILAAVTLIRRDELAPVVAEVEPAEPALDLAA